MIQVFNIPDWLESLRHSMCLQQVQPGKPALFSDQEREAYTNCVKNQPLMRGQFSIIVDMPDIEIGFVNGLYQTMGYSEDFGYYDLLTLIPEEYLEGYLAYMRAYYAFNEQSSHRSSPFSQTFGLQIPLRHYHGELYNFAQLCAPLQVDGQGKVLSYVFHFCLLGIFKPDSPLVMEPFVLQFGKRILEWERKIVGMVSPLILKPLSNREREILELYAASTDVLTCKHISQLLDIAEDTVYVHHKSILRKLNSIFKAGFRSARDAALFCYARGYLGE